MQDLLATTGLRAMLVAAAAGALFAFSWGQVAQPIAFNHRLHVEDLGLACTDCHLYAESGPRATIPNLAVCSDCHEEAQGDSPAEALLVEYIQEQTLVPWRKIYRLPEHVFFSHRRHTAIAGIACDTCHGPIGQREEPVTRPLVRLTMGRCMDCHEQEGASNDCLVCHR